MYARGHGTIDTVFNLAQSYWDLLSDRGLGSLKGTVTSVIMITCNQGLLYPSMCGLGHKAGLSGLLKGV